MPRPISWLPRIHEIRRTVEASIRSHYERKDIEILFQLQPRAAQLLLEMLPATVVGRSRLVEKQALSDFLNRIADAENPSRELETIRRQDGQVSRKKPRTMVRRDIDPLQLDSLPPNIEFLPGQITVSFHTIEQLAESMYSLARIIETDGDELARRYEFREANEPNPEREEFDAMLRELESMERTAVA
jgi:hypothetical protein